MNDISTYLSLPYAIVLQRDDEGDVVATIPDLDGCMADGVDEAEALANLASAQAAWIAAALDAGQEIPRPASAKGDLPSGKWLQRVPRSLHQKLVKVAEADGVSLNQFVACVLAEAVGEKRAAPRTVDRPTVWIQHVETPPQQWDIRSRGNAGTVTERLGRLQHLSRNLPERGGWDEIDHDHSIKH